MLEWKLGSRECYSTGIATQVPTAGTEPNAGADHAAKINPRKIMPDQLLIRFLVNPDS